MRTDKLNNVPPGTYNLYLYGINNTGTRGTTFTVSTPAIPLLTLSTFNTPASLTSFISGADYVVFTNVVLSEISRDKSGVASGANTTVRQTGNALGTAIIGSVPSSLVQAMTTGPSSENMNTPSIPFARRKVSSAWTGLWVIGPPTLKDVFTATSTPIRLPSAFKYA